MRVTGTLQREAWLRKELPPVERVVPGVWSVPVPIPDNPLRYVLSYLHRAPVRVRPGGPGLGCPGELAGADRRAWRRARSR